MIERSSVKFDPKTGKFSVNVTVRYDSMLDIGNDVIEVYITAGSFGSWRKSTKPIGVIFPDTSTLNTISEIVDPPFIITIDPFKKNVNVRAEFIIERFAGLPTSVIKSRISVYEYDPLTTRKVIKWSA